MTAQADPYVRVYYRIVDDPKFAEVFDHDARLATWLRLLLLADGTYPAPAPIPFGVSKAALAHLVSVGLVDLEPGNRFRIHGMAGERGTRSEKAADAARKRWRSADAMQPQSGSNAGASGPASDTRMHSAPLLSSPTRSTPLRAESRAPGDDVWATTQVVEQLTDRQFTFGPGNQAFDTLAADVSALGKDRVVAEYRQLRAETDGSPMDAAQLIFGGHKRLFPIPAAPANGRRAAAAKGHQPDMSEVDRAFDQH